MTLNPEQIIPILSILGGLLSFYAAWCRSRRQEQERAEALARRRQEAEEAYRRARADDFADLCRQIHATQADFHQPDQDIQEV